MKLPHEGLQEQGGKSTSGQTNPVALVENHPHSCYPDAICPLCSQFFPRGELHDHIGSERPDLRANTTVVIQAYHPGWEVEHGACETCWKSYRDAGRMLSLLRTSRPQGASVPKLTKSKS